MCSMRDDYLRPCHPYGHHNLPCHQERKVMEMPIEEKLEACRNFRWRGNLFHAEGQYRRGALQYRQVTTI